MKRIFFDTIWQFPALEKTLFHDAKLHREYITEACDKETDIIDKCRGFVTNDYQKGYLVETQKQRGQSL